MPSSGRTSAIISALKPVKVPISSTRRAPEATRSVCSRPSTTGPLIMPALPMRSSVTRGRSARYGGTSDVCSVT